MENPKLSFTEADFDNMVDIMLESKDSMFKTVVKMLDKGYKENVISAFFRTINAISDHLEKADSRERLMGIKAYSILRINFEVMDDIPKLDKVGKQIRAVKEVVEGKFD